MSKKNFNVTYKYTTVTDNAVVCIATVFTSDFIWETSNDIRELVTDVCGHIKTPERITSPIKQFKGVALRKEGEAVDIELAKKVAKAKAQKALNRWIIRQYDSYEACLFEVIEHFRAIKARAYSNFMNSDNFLATGKTDVESLAEFISFAKMYTEGDTNDD